MCRASTTPATPTGIGLGWVHTAGSNNVDIIEKTGGGAGFLTYIAMLPAQHLALFVAATDGAIETHINLFRNANNVLLTLGPASHPLYPPPATPTPTPATHVAHVAHVAPKAWTQVLAQPDPLPMPLQLCQSEGDLVLAFASHLATNVPL